MVRIKRVYEKHDNNDGQRILIDRLWPRGLSKDDAKIDMWLKDIAPSTELRRWFSHDPTRWREFQRRYQAELDTNQEAVQRLRDCLNRGSATLVYGAKDEQYNDAVVLQKYLETVGK